MPEKVLHIDIETRSDIDLSKAGVYPYSESNNFDILIVAAAIDDDEIACFDLASGDTLPEWFTKALADPDYIKVAHHAAFERVCFSRLLYGRRSYTFLDPSQWHCTMVHAAMLGLPFSLDGVAKVLGTGEQKDKAGTDLIKYFCVPCKPTESNGGRTWNNPADAPEKWASFKSYCLQDVATERDIYHRLQRFPIPESERLVYILDQQINDRGVLIDLQMVEQAIKCDLLHSEILTRRAYELTSLENPNSVSQLKMWLEERGLSMDTLGKKQVAAQIRELDKNGCDAELLEMLKLRLQMAKSSVKKYQAAERAVSADGRARGLFKDYGASHTGRWASRSIQLQNCPANHLSTLDEARELLKLGAFDMLEILYGNTPDVLSQLIRTMIVPKAGCEFVVADFSAIEARVLAWLACEQWRLDSFNAGADIYCASASQMFGIPVVKNGVNGHLRQKGKVAELACIAEDQLVLTNSGYRPIQSVTKSMLVWDGRAWVKHSGVVRRGVRRTMTFEGLTATPDHLVWNGYRFVPFEYYAAMKDSANGGRDIIYSGLRRVYDIKNCGPRHQFLVNGHIVHNCGYGGAAGALIAMGALDMGLKESELPDLISDWRNANPRIVQYWWDVDKAATDTVKTGNLNTVGLITFERYAGELFITLPSGRKLAYASPRLEPNRFGRMGITYMSIGTNNKWQRLETYGPKVVENCISGDTLVITTRGFVRIDEIRDDDLIWDGIEFVSHEGLINKGCQKTVSVSGLHMTPNHKILTEKGWMNCEQAEGFNWHEVSLPHSSKTCGELKRRQSAMAMLMRLRKLQSGTSRAFVIKKTFDKVLRLYDIKDFINKYDYPWNVETPRMGRVAFDEPTMRRASTSGISQLRRSRYYGMYTMAAQFRAVLGGYGSHLSKGSRSRPNRQQQRVLAGKLPMGNAQSEQSESPYQSYYRNSLRSDDCISTERGVRYRSNNAAISSGSLLADRITVCETGLEECVYDIRNCGSRHRFAIWDERAGKARIVSNCTQAIARDLLAEAMLRVRDAGYDIILHCHDEMCVEVPKGTLTVDALCKLMSVNPSWAEGLPLNADGYACPYYQKS